MDREFLLSAYSQMYGPEAGPWNLSVASKYLEFRLAQFFEEHFSVIPGTKLCNIGIGAGAWDRYLSYQLSEGSLTSIDMDAVCCRQLREGLLCEENPNRVEVLCADVMALDLENYFDIVTMVGSTAMESGEGLSIVEKAMSFVKPGGSMYYQSLDEHEEKDSVLQAAERSGMRLEKYLQDDAYGYLCRYYQFTK